MKTPANPDLIMRSRAMLEFIKKEIPQEMDISKANSTQRCLVHAAIYINTLCTALEVAEVRITAQEAEKAEGGKYLSGVMYALAEMVSIDRSCDVHAIETASAAGKWEEYKKHANAYDLKRFAKVVGRQGISALKN